MVFIGLKMAYFLLDYVKFYQGIQVIRYAFMLVIALIFVACAKKQPTTTQDLKTQIQGNAPSITFAQTKSENNHWYKTHLYPIAKSSKNKNVNKELEIFAKLYFADLSQIFPKNPVIPKDKLLQSVSFTYFTQNLFQEYLFLMTQDSILAPWEYFWSPIDFGNSIESASFVANIADSMQYLENQSYNNLNNIVLANSLLDITQKYTDNQTTSNLTQNITDIKSYILPQHLRSLLFYKILYFTYLEKFESNFILDSMATHKPTSMLQAMQRFYLSTPPKNQKSLQTQFKFPNFDPSNPVSLMQCKAGNSNFRQISSCIHAVFIPWIKDLQVILRKQAQNYFFPIFTDSKLCLVIESSRIIKYPNNNERFCNALYQTWKQAIQSH